MHAGMQACMHARMHAYGHACIHTHRYVDHLGEEIPWNVINWDMGTPVGVWGGHCTCPDG